MRNLLEMLPTSEVTKLTLQWKSDHEAGPGFNLPKGSRGMELIKE